MRMRDRSVWACARAATLIAGVCLGCGLASTAAAARWSAPVVLPGSAGTDRPPVVAGALNPELAMDSAGDSIVGWEKPVGSGNRTIVQAETRPAGGAFGVPQDLTAPEAEASLVLTMDAAGDAVAAWQKCPTGSFPCSRFVIQAAVRRAGASFSTPAVISPARQDSLYPGLAINAHGDALAVWMREKSQIGSGQIAEYKFGSSR